MDNTAAVKSTINTGPTIDVSKLTGPKLAYWVAKALGWGVRWTNEHMYCYDEKGVPHSFGVDGFRPDLNWAQGGKIIGEHSIDFEDGGMYAIIDHDHEGVWASKGSDHLESAMRVFVLYKIGKKVPKHAGPNETDAVSGSSAPCVGQQGVYSMRPVEELLGMNLSYWVAKARGWEILKEDCGNGFFVYACQDEQGNKYGFSKTGFSKDDTDIFRPDLNYDQAKPILDEAGVQFEYDHDDDDPSEYAVIDKGNEDADRAGPDVWTARGPTRLVSGLRVYLKMKLGNYVDPFEGLPNA